MKQLRNASKGYLGNVMPNTQFTLISLYIFHLAIHGTFPLHIYVYRRIFFLFYKSIQRGARVGLPQVHILWLIPFNIYECIYCTLHIKIQKRAIRMRTARCKLYTFILFYFFFHTHTASTHSDFLLAAFILQHSYCNRESKTNLCKRRKTC